MPDDTPDPLTPNDAPSTAVSRFAARVLDRQDRLEDKVNELQVSLRELVAHVSTLAKVYETREGRETTVETTASELARARTQYDTEIGKARWAAIQGFLGNAAATGTVVGTVASVVMYGFHLIYQAVTGSPPPTLAP